MTDCEQIGCLPILIIPPGNDASTPNLSYARAIDQCRRPRVHLPGDCWKPTRSRPAIRIDAIAGYREIVSEQPTHAWAHYRLACLLNSPGRSPRLIATLFSLVIAMVCRCALISPLEAIYHSVGLRHPRSLVIDGPAVLRSKSRHGILDAELFHDIVHPTLAGHVALAEAVLSGLKARAAFGLASIDTSTALDPRALRHGVRHRSERRGPSSANGRRVFMGRSRS